MRIGNILLACAIITGSLTCLASAQKKTNLSPDQKLEARVAELEKRIAILEAQINAQSSHTPAATQPELVGETKTDAKNAPLVLDDWDFSTQSGDFGQSCYAITLKLRNAGGKTIKLLDASVQFADLLDAHLYGIKITPDINIAPGATDVNTGQYEINQFINEQNRMRVMKKADIKATLTIHKIVFTDNTVLNLDP